MPGARSLKFATLTLGNVRGADDAVVPWAELPGAGGVAMGLTRDFAMAPIPTTRVTTARPKTALTKLLRGGGLPSGSWGSPEPSSPGPLMAWCASSAERDS